MIFLPDVNVLIALAWQNHPQHVAARNWFSANASGGWATCLITQSGFLRLSLNPRVVGVTIDCPTAVGLLHALVAHPQHHFVADAPPMNGIAFSPLVPRISGYRQITDAALLWFARHHGMKLATFDAATAVLSPWPDAVELLVP